MCFLMGVVPDQSSLCRRHRVLSVVPIEARSAGVVLCWCGRWMRKATLTAARAAEHAVAADRFAHEIVCFLKARCGALAAAERQTVRRLMPVAFAEDLSI